MRGAASAKQGDLPTHQWSPDGRALVLHDFASGRADDLLTFAPADGNRFTVSPDGEMLVYDHSDIESDLILVEDFR